MPALADLGRVHIMGIAGAGMSGLARILLERGVAVSGCEARDSLGVSQLRALGADVLIGHSVDHLADADTFVYTTAINPRHEEFAAARESGMRVLRRAAALAAGLEGKRIVAIAGTHGKTSTTSLLTVGAQECGVDPSFAIGGNLYETGKNAHLGSGDLAIVEADESDGSFLLTGPALAVVTNVEADHLENHGDLEGIFRAFELFVDRIDRARHAAGLRGRPGCAAHRRPRARPRAAGAHVRHRPGCGGAGHATSARCRTPSSSTSPGWTAMQRHVRVASLIGAHMALNATAALVLAAELGLDLDTVAGSWADFAGVHRRFEFHGEGGGVRVFDDYAHHPTEIAASLGAAKASLAGTGRLIAVFQPGTYSRTQTFAREFADAMAIADIAVVMDIFPAREEPIPGVTGATISDLIDLPPEAVVYEPSFGAVPERIAALARPGDLVITMGIGNVYVLCDDIVRALRGRRRDDLDRPVPARRTDAAETAPPPAARRKLLLAAIAAVVVVVAARAGWSRSARCSASAPSRCTARARSRPSRSPTPRTSPTARHWFGSTRTRSRCGSRRCPPSPPRRSRPRSRPRVASPWSSGSRWASSSVDGQVRPGRRDRRAVPHRLRPPGAAAAVRPAGRRGRGAERTRGRARRRRRCPRRCWRRSTRSVALDPDTITIDLADGRTVAWGSAADTAAKVRLLPVLLEAGRARVRLSATRRTRSRADPPPFPAGSRFGGRRPRQLAGKSCACPTGCRRVAARLRRFRAVAA